MAGYRIATHCPYKHPYSGDNLKVYDMRRKGKVYKHKMCVHCNRVRSLARNRNLTLAEYYAKYPNML